MTCPRCNATIADSATFCNNCGSPVAAGSTSGPASFSYLPTGAPPWPTNTEHVPHRERTASQSLQTAQSTGTNTNASDTKDLVGSKPGRSIRGTFGIIAIFALSILIGAGTSLGVLWANGDIFSNNSAAPVSVHLPISKAGGSPAPAISPTPAGNLLPNPTSFQSISMSSLGISVKYPADWQKLGPQAVSSDITEVDFSPQQQLGIDIRFRRFSANASATIKDASEATQATLVDFSRFQGVSNFQPTTAAAQPTIGGVQWIEQDATFTDPNNTSYHFVAAAVQHKKQYYIIFFYSPNQFFNEAVQKYIQPMLASFQFLP